MFNDPEIEAMYRNIAGRAELAGIRAVNEMLARIYDDSQVRVPKGDPEKHTRRERDQGSSEPYPAKPLVERGHIVEATPENPVGMVYYEGPYAAAQEVGAMEYEGRSGKPVDWVAHHYTTSGTGPRYLEDSMKKHLGNAEEEVAVQARIAFGEIPGMALPAGRVQSVGREIELAAPPSGDLAREMAVDQNLIQSASESSFIVPHVPQ